MSGANHSDIANATQAPSNKKSVTVVVMGEPASKANSRKVVKIGNVSRLIKSSKALKYAAEFQRQVLPIEPLMEQDVKMIVHIWYASRRPDLDESLLLDLLQGVVYVNDRQVKERHTYWHLDRQNPRSIIYIEEM